MKLYRMFYLDKYGTESLYKELTIIILGDAFSMKSSTGEEILDQLMLWLDSVPEK